MRAMIFFCARKVSSVRLISAVVNHIQKRPMVQMQNEKEKCQESKQKIGQNT